MVNCNFINNNGLFFIHFMRFICENCNYIIIINNNNNKKKNNNNNNNNNISSLILTNNKFPKIYFIFFKFPFFF